LSKNSSVYDASGLIVGRLASYVAKKLLQGESVVVVNAEKAVVSGSRSGTITKVSKRLKMRSHGALEKGPKRPRRPDNILRRAVRGMLPWKTPKGKTAYKRLRVCLGLPEEYRGATVQTVPSASASKLRCKYAALEELARKVGWEGE